ncbi:hypothetical protein ACHMXB_22315 (plasmid) [Arthrobacter sp. UC242_113]|uniref:hypothetical protein n=1 Tax=Arthrobacter sp. UC242_113 TaxID=3374550 RepID=UPI003757F055
MRTSDQIDRPAQARHLQEALLTRVAKGREWATPGVEAALRRALTGIDAGLETASPRLQASLRTIADELAGRIETATPRLHDRIARLLPLDGTTAQAIPPKTPTRMLWWFIPATLAAAAGGVALWRVMRSGPEPEIGAAPAAPLVGEASTTPPPESVI